MKKILAMLVVMATVSTVMGQWVYNSGNYADSKNPAGGITPGYAPVFMRGFLKTTDWYQDATNCTYTKKYENYQVYLSFCQPCINCVSKCVGTTLDLKNVVIYIVEKVPATRTAHVTVHPIGDQRITVTRKTARDTLVGSVATELFAGPGLGHAKYGTIKPIQLVGDWNQRTWFTGKDEANSLTTYPAIMSIIRVLDGSVSTAGANPDFAAGTLNLRRDDNMTLQLMLQMAYKSAGNAAGSYNPFFDSCTDAPAAGTTQTCEKIMEPAGAGTPAGVGTTGIRKYIKATLGGYTESWIEL